MDKMARTGAVILAATIITIVAAGIAGFLVGGQNTRNRFGIESNLGDQRELLQRIGEYQQREQARAERERSRIAVEDSRIRAARERADRLETAVSSLRGLDRRSSELFSELIAEVKLLANNVGCSSDCDCWTHDRSGN
jgi:hypothetical protein